MANYYANSRTNYFRVTNEDKYNELFSNLVGDEDTVQDFTKTVDGVTLHGFGCYGSVNYKKENDTDYDFDFFLNELQKILPDNEVFIYIENGHEKLCYLTGFSIIVSKDKIESVDIISDSIEKAREMLCNSKYHTDMNY